MRYVLLKDVKPGMRLGSDIYDAYGRILLGVRAELTEEYLSKLLEMGFDGLYISDELSEDINLESVISPELRGKGIDCVRMQDVDGCLIIAKEMVKEIIEKGTISLDMTDLRESDDITYAHSVNVAIYSCIIGMAMGLSEKELDQLVMAGLLHDLGKMAIPSEILNKKGRLTPEEYQVMKSHAKLSYDLIKGRWDVPTHVKVAVLFHHENVNGSGYPNGITADEQTQFTKIIHVADVYDALISKRPYKEPYSAYEASEYLMGACGIMFDQDVVTALLRYVPLYPKGTQMVLSDGRECIIVDNTGIHNLRPVVRLLDGTDIDLAEKSNLAITIVAANTAGTFSEDIEEGRKEMVKEFKRFKVLVVDDMITNLQLLRGILEHLYDVTLVKSGNQALAYLSKNEVPDVIIMDIDMPGMDGIETTREINKRTGGQIPVLFVTTIGDTNTVKTCQELGAAGYIIRPYKPAFIKSELKRILTGRGDVD